MSEITPPTYFDEIRSDRERRWQQLESDEELAGPWRQLFSQVQSPRHVISELLQNADDAGAKNVRVSVTRNEFVFEHDGADFTREDFSSLCQFGFSNKRRLHTIGFRGMGFKTAFSLGDDVLLATPTLRVRFHSSRFTLPHWDERLEGPSPYMSVRVTVPFKAGELYEAALASLDEWRRSPASLLFFRSIVSLDLNGIAVRRIDLGPGPAPGSRRIRLESESAREVLMFESEEAEPPDEAVAEIRQERRDPNFAVPPIIVQVVIGLDDPQRAYVVLPTGSIFTDLPFSCNAPFIQDPSRYGLKDPAASPLNQWLLRRTGQLTAKALRNWLGNHSLTAEERARAYELLPASTAEKAGPIAAIVLREMESVLKSQPLVLTSCGSVAEASEVFAPPALARDVWGDDLGVLRALFRGSWAHLLSNAVSGDAKQRLARWTGLQPLTDADLWKRLEQLPDSPRPATYDRLLKLHAAAQREFAGRDPRAAKRRLLALWPTQSGGHLRAAEHLVRLPEVPETLRAFLSEYLHSLDPGWERFLRDHDSPEIDAARDLLEQCGLARTTERSEIIQTVLLRLSRSHPAYEEIVVMLAHAAAALDAQVPPSFPYLCRDGAIRTADRGLFSPAASLIDRLLPHGWVLQKVLNDRYDLLSAYCDAKTWRTWLLSPRCRLLSVPLPGEVTTFTFSRQSFDEMLTKLGSKQVGEFRYRTSDFQIVDYDFDGELWEHWEEVARADPEWWTRLAIELARAWAMLQPVSRVRAKQFARTGSYDWIAIAPAPARWIRRLQERECLPATDGRQYRPGDLLLLNEQTRPFLGLHPFVREDLFSEEARDFLRLLGVRERFHDVNLPLNRIRALTNAPNPDACIEELRKWYEVIAQALVAADGDTKRAVTEAFSEEALILTDQSRWAKATEVCVSVAPEDREFALAIHPALRHLRLWDALGVPEAPSFESARKWLQALPRGAKLAPDERRRAERLLRKFGAAAWSECGCWLSADGAWTPTEWLQFGTVRRLVLHPEIAAKTADLTMLDAATAEAPPFNGLRRLDREVRFQLAARVLDPHQPTPRWLRSVADHLARVRADDRETAETVRAAARDLASAGWVEVTGGVTLQVAPFLDGSQVGPAQSVGALWDRYGSKTVYVAGRPAQHLNDLVDELTKPFAVPWAADAIRYCVLRDPDFIAEYFASHFELEEPRADVALPAQAEAPPVGATAARTPPSLREGAERFDGGASGTSTPRDHPPVQGSYAPEDVDEEEEDSSWSEPRRKRSRAFDPFRQFAESQGFSWNPEKGCFERPDGAIIIRDDAPFSWRELDPTSERTRRYAVARGRLPFPGLRLSEELWRELEAHPERAALVAVDDEGAFAIPGTELREAVRVGGMVLVPAAYWLRAIEPSRAP